MQIKIFGNANPEILQNKVNTWLREEYDKMKVVDIKYQDYQASSDGGYDPYSSVMVMYIPYAPGGTLAQYK